MGLIYKATSPSGKFYIGKTKISLKERKRLHVQNASLRWKKRGYTRFAHAIRKYGIENFKWEILESDICGDELNNRERHYIKLYDARGKGYNMTLGGDGGDTFTNRSSAKKVKARAIMSKNNKGSNNPNYGNGQKFFGKLNPMYGKSVFSVWVEKYGTEEAIKRDLICREKKRVASSAYHAKVRIMKKCIFCDIEFYPKSQGKHQKYCSRGCFYSSRRQKGNLK